MSPDQAGVLRTLAKRGLDRRNEDGKQFVSWVHESDFCSCIDSLIADASLTGPVNVASPNPLPNREFMRELRQACGVKFGLPAAKWMLEIVAGLMKTETELLLKSLRVVPGKLIDAGYQFKLLHWGGACLDLVHGRFDCFLMADRL